MDIIFININEIIFRRILKKFHYILDVIWSLHQNLSHPNLYFNIQASIYNLFLIFISFDQNPISQNKIKIILENISKHSFNCLDNLTSGFTKNLLLTIIYWGCSELIGLIFGTIRCALFDIGQIINGILFCQIFVYCLANTFFLIEIYCNITN